MNERNNDNIDASGMLVFCSGDRTVALFRSWSWSNFTFASFAPLIQTYRSLRQLPLSNAAALHPSNQ
jgi:hypothetical protein